jgi:hypothetical protein
MADAEMVRHNYRNVFAGSGRLLAVARTYGAEAEVERERTPQAQARRSCILLWP